ncbi:carbohydrate kinase [Schizopora paradoxa]|uniref:gluconokinase n=1 Tax=Schizopora paradoxa TaxID=27342 RepID=A0A0H2S8A7_9AGAM|nr:carbohydrate kinase [Schizopora paradoxa]
MENGQDKQALQSELALEGHSSPSEGPVSTEAVGVNGSELPSTSDRHDRKPEDGRSASQPMLVIVMGVSGCGKSTLGHAVADALRLPFIDGDSLHPSSNIEKMSQGTPLNDEDRKPWLELIRTRAEHVAAEQQHQHHHTQSGGGADQSVASETGEEPKQAHGLVVACSSLKRRYRAILRGHEESDGSALPEGVEPPHPDALPTFFLYIKGERETLVKRMSERKGHFMKTEMLDSQLATLESPEGEEGVVTVRLEDETEKQVTEAVQGLTEIIQAKLSVSS